MNDFAEFLPSLLDWPSRQHATAASDYRSKFLCLVSLEAHEALRQSLAAAASLPSSLLSGAVQEAVEGSAGSLTRLSIELDADAAADAVAVGSLRDRSFVVLARQRDSSSSSSPLLFSPRPILGLVLNRIPGDSCVEVAVAAKRWKRFADAERGVASSKTGREGRKQGMATGPRSNNNDPALLLPAYQGYFDRGAESEEDNEGGAAGKKRPREEEDGSAQQADRRKQKRRRDALGSAWDDTDAFDHDDNNETGRLDLLPEDEGELEEEEEILLADGCVAASATTAFSADDAPRSGLSTLKIVLIPAGSAVTGLRELAAVCRVPNSHPFILSSLSVSAATEQQPALAASLTGSRWIKPTFPRSLFAHLPPTARAALLLPPTPLHDYHRHYLLKRFNHSQINAIVSAALGFSGSASGLVDSVVARMMAAPSSSSSSTAAPSSSTASAPSLDCPRSMKADRITLVVGPPGTGKTTVALGLLNTVVNVTKRLQVDVLAAFLPDVAGELLVEEKAAAEAQASSSSSAAAASPLLSMPKLAAPAPPVELKKEPVPSLQETENQADAAKNTLEPAVQLAVVVAQEGDEEDEEAEAAEPALVAALPSIAATVSSPSLAPAPAFSVPWKSDVDAVDPVPSRWLAAISEYNWLPLPPHTAAPCLLSEFRRRTAQALRRHVEASIVAPLFKATQHRHHAGPNSALYGLVRRYLFSPTLPAALPPPAPSSPGSPAVPPWRKADFFCPPAPPSFGSYTQPPDPFPTARLLAELVLPAFETGPLRHRILVCAPSNTATDNLVLRLTKDGMKGSRIVAPSSSSPSQGQLETFMPSILRVGEGAGASVKEVSGGSISASGITLEGKISVLLGEKAADEGAVASAAGAAGAADDKSGAEKKRRLPSPPRRDDVQKWRQILQQEREGLLGQITQVKSQFQLHYTQAQTERRAQGQLQSLFYDGCSRIVSFLRAFERNNNKLNQCYLLESLLEASDRVEALIACESRNATAAERSYERHYRETRRELGQLLLGGADIVFTTTSSAALASLERFCSSGGTFDFVLIDESTQSVEPSALIPLTRYGCSHAVLLGDPMQLQPTIISKRASEQGYGVSLFQRLAEQGHFVHLLNTQYRSHPDLSAFPSGYLYGGKLKDHASLVGPGSRRDIPLLRPLSTAAGPAASSLVQGSALRLFDLKNSTEEVLLTLASCSSAAAAAAAAPAASSASADLSSYLPPSVLEGAASGTGALRGIIGDLAAAGFAPSARDAYALRNPDEAQVVLRLLEALKTWRGKVVSAAAAHDSTHHGAGGHAKFQGTVGVISFYRGQVQLLKRLILGGVGAGSESSSSSSAASASAWPFKIDVNTVDGYQGQERDIVIVSSVRTRDAGADAGAGAAKKEGVRRKRLVVQSAGTDAEGKAEELLLPAALRSKLEDAFLSPAGGEAGDGTSAGGIGFVDDARRLNVAITRARFACFVVGDMQALASSSSHWKALVEHCSTCEGEGRVVTVDGNASVGAESSGLAE